MPKRGLKKLRKERLAADLEIIQDFEYGRLILKPKGVINPSLVKEDLKCARDFSQKIHRDWNYISNVEDVKLVNPFNLLYLKEIKKLQKLKKIIVYAPGLVNRTLIRLASFLIKPDLILKNKREFYQFLNAPS